MERFVSRCEALDLWPRRGCESHRPQSIDERRVKTEDEGLFVIQHSYWRETLEKALAQNAS